MRRTWLTLIGALSAGACQLLLDVEYDGGAADDGGAPAPADATTPNGDGGAPANEPTFEIVDAVPTFNGGRVLVLSDLFEAIGAAYAPASKRVYVAGRAGKAVDRREPSAFAVVGLTETGALDVGFAGGIVKLWRPGNITRDQLNDMTLDDAGRVLVVGNVNADDSPVFAGIARIDADGGVDPSFGDGGWTVVGSDSERAVHGRAVAVYADGKIMLAGSVQVISDGEWEVLTMRLRPNGTRDPSFDDRRDFGHDDGAWDVVIDDQGRALIVGDKRANPDTNTDAFTLRLQQDGGFDPSWNGTGRRQLEVPAGDDVAFSVVRDRDGRHFVGGAYAGGTAGFATLLTSTSASDAGFGSQQGGATEHFVKVGSVVRAIAIDDDGRAIVAGFTTSSAGTVGFVAKLTETGQPDLTFGRGKPAREITSPGAEVRVRAVAAMPQGVLVVGDVARGGVTFRGVAAMLAR